LPVPRRAIAASLSKFLLNVYSCGEGSGGAI
jgi:hypothetical protein